MCQGESVGGKECHRCALFDPRIQVFNPTCSKYRVIEEHDLPGYAGILSAPALTSVARESLQNDAPALVAP